MQCVLPLLVCGAALACPVAMAQEAPPGSGSISGTTLPAGAPVTIEGKVVDDQSGLGLRRATIYLRAMDGGLPGFAVEGDEYGRFTIRDVRPGNYRLEARRDGYMPGLIARRDGYRLPAILYFDSSQRWTNVEFRLRKWGVIAGRVRYDDAEPATNANVQVFRTLRLRGRVTYQLAGSALTNDRGEYRVFGLAPGSYYVAATSRTDPPAAGGSPLVVEQARRDRNGLDTPPMSYPTTFYPNTYRLTQAAPVRVDAAQEIGAIDIYLQPVRKVRVRGQVLSGLTGRVLQNASVSVFRMDADESVAMTAPVAAIPIRGGPSQPTYELRYLTPGLYLAVADADEERKRLTVRRVLVVTETDVENFDLTVGPAVKWEGRVVVANREVPPETLRIAAEPRSDRAAVVTADVSKSGEFDLTLQPGETYDLFVQNLPAGLFIEAVRSGATQYLASGLSGEPPRQGIDVLLSAKGGTVTGRVFTEDGNVATGANLMLIPDPPVGRLQSYRETLADEFAFFRMSGVTPGKYLLVAWVDEPPCDVFDAEEMDRCRTAGTVVTVGESGGATVPVVLRPPRR